MKKFFNSYNFFDDKNQKKMYINKKLYDVEFEHLIFGPAVS